MKKCVIALLVLALAVCSSGCLYKAEDISRVVAAGEADFHREEEVTQKVVETINTRRTQHGKKALHYDAAASRKMTQTLRELGIKGDKEAFRAAYGKILPKSQMLAFKRHPLNVEELVQQLEKASKKDDYRYVCVGVYRSPDRGFFVLVLLHNGS